jgi:hypothetical protein
MIDLMVILSCVNGIISGTRRWYGNTSAARLPSAGCKPILSVFRFDNNGQNIQFTGRKFMLLTA